MSCCRGRSVETQLATSPLRRLTHAAPPHLSEWEQVKWLEARGCSRIWQTVRPFDGQVRWRGYDGRDNDREGSGPTLIAEWETVPRHWWASAIPFAFGMALAAAYAWIVWGGPVPSF